MKHRLNVLAGVIALLLLFGVIGCKKDNAAPEKKDKKDSTEVTTPPAKTDSLSKADTLGNHSPNKAPGFTLEDLNGKKISLSDYSGKVILIDFWATWCPPCREGIPDLVAIQKQYGDDLVVIGISVDAEDTKGEVPGFAREQKINYPILYTDGSVEKAFGGIEFIPTGFLINKEGNIVEKFDGLNPKESYTKAIDKLLK